MKMKSKKVAALKTAEPQPNDRPGVNLPDKQSLHVYPGGMPSRPQYRKKKPGIVPAVPHLSPAILRGASLIAPDLITVNTIKWDDLVPQDASYNGVAGGGNSVYVEPHGPMMLNYTLIKNLVPRSQGLLIARVEDGVIAPVHIDSNLPVTYGTTTGQLQLDGWLSPFPANLYGYHRLDLDLYVASDDGAPLPNEVQTNPPNNGLFTFESTSWCWLNVSPGCRSFGGLAWSALTLFNVTPTALPLDNTGTRFGANAQVKIDWSAEAAPLPATSYGYPGSWRGVRFYFPDGTAQDSPLISGSLLASIVGMPFFPGAGITILANDTSGCGFQAASKPLMGVKPSAPPPQPSPANVVIQSTWYEFDDSEDINLQPGQTFTANFLVANLGGKSSASIEAAMSLDEGEETLDLTKPGIAPASAITVQWPFNSGLPEGSHDIQINITVGTQIVSSNLSIAIFGD